MLFFGRASLIATLLLASACNPSSDGSSGSDAASAPTVESTPPTYAELVAAPGRFRGTQIEFRGTFIFGEIGGTYYDKCVYLGLTPEGQVDPSQAFVVQGSNFDCGAEAERQPPYRGHLIRGEFSGASEESIRVGDEPRTVTAPVLINAVLVPQPAEPTPTD